jgi:hypothetical protein
MDTDSYIYHIKTEHFYRDMGNIIGHFDTIDYPVNNKYGLPTVNKKELGKMKDENNGKIMEEFIGLRLKMYACKVGTKEQRKSKGVKKSVVKNEITFEDYGNCLFKQEELYRKMNLIRSVKHDIYITE